jgi:hypothetical protein
MNAELKDETLNRLAERWNVAQFVSFAPGSEPLLRHARLRGEVRLPSRRPDLAIRALMQRSPSGMVNVRAFTVDRMKGNPFHYGLRTVEDAVSLVRGLAAEGLFTIVNETIDVDDGGISGVRLGGVTEFAPGGTPRIVEEGGVVSAPDWLADRLLSAVYGVEAPRTESGTRLEFSIHPQTVGLRAERTVVWEVEGQEAELDTRLSWPNRFSRHIGDKTFGLLVAEALGAPVPRSLVLARSVPPFEFGRPTPHAVCWVRTAPRDFAAGRYTTVRGWADPFALLAKEDPSGDVIGAVLVQSGISAAWSGAARFTGDDAVIEGVRGAGDEFMLGERAPEPLPPDVRSGVARTCADLAALIGPLRLEWVADETTIWVLQLNQLTTAQRSSPDPAAGSWIEFDPDDGLDRLRELIVDALDRGSGIRVTRPVGLTSHVGDLLRQAGVPATITGPA